MTSIVQPIHDAVIGEGVLRFFKAPLPHVHLPWHSWDDINTCLSVPRDLRQYLLSRLKEDHGGDVRTVATARGITTIAPHWMAQGIISSMIELHRADITFELAYTRGVVAAWEKMMGPLSPGESIETLCSAYRNSNGLNGGAA